MKKHLKILFFLVLVGGLFSFAMHKYYVSTTNVNYSSKDKSIQIISRIFIDDIEQTINERYGINCQLDSDKELKEAHSYLKKYITQKFKLYINGKETPYNFLGKEYELDEMKCYLEVPNINIATIKSIAIENTLLFDMFPEQQNIIHFKLNEKVKSFVLSRDNTKALLKI
ncbi:hypothetical protein NBRC110019_12420 [Neptunitalea chrysea]|uniref:Peptidase E n=1 Tax=Neptunitalea chrysea TaxID=1647581 RepID=A0A9W6B404_9FLAO|nr:DUF6702 family protein [Neptunitalea chrysea]GLB52203.1 hypothetical protein NBRC110019_12420 [Neptunitalea chrysea]